MFQTALIFFFCGISLFFPLFFWTYITSTFSQYRLKRIHFLVGIFLGALVMSMVGASQYIPYGLGISSVLTSLSLIANISAL